MPRKRSSSKVSLSAALSQSDTGSLELPTIKRVITNRNVRIIKEEGNNQLKGLGLPPLMEPEVQKGTIA